MADDQNLSRGELLALQSTLALLLSEGKTADEINFLGNLLTAVGAILITFGAQN